MPVMRDVFSSHVDAIGYDDETKALHVRWQGGKVSVYSGVPPEVANSTMNAYSIGKALREDIKPNYPHRYL